MDTAEKLLIDLGAKIVKGPEDCECAPKYCYVLFNIPIAFG